jgi:hypothetical protein
MESTLIKIVKEALSTPEVKAGIEVILESAPIENATAGALFFLAADAKGTKKEMVLCTIMYIESLEKEIANLKAALTAQPL